MTKISVIGAGNVGATTAFLIAQKQLGDVVLIDIVEGLPQGKALDIKEAMPIEGSNSILIGSNNYKDIKDSDIVVITAGLPRKPGMTREDLLVKNASIIKDVCENVKKYAPDSIVIMVTNPLDVMTYLAQKITGFEYNKVIGQAGVLDSTRLSAFIKEKLGVGVEDIKAMTLGSHGDSMVPVLSQTTVKGKPITEYLSEEEVNQLIERTRKGGSEIVSYLKKGSAYYAPAASIVKMVEAILKEKEKILPCSAYLTSQYNISGIYIGVPVKLDRRGVKEIIELNLSKQELSALQNSAKICQENINKLKSMTDYLEGCS